MLVCCVHCTCGGGVLFISWFEDAVLWETRSTFYCEPTSYSGTAGAKAIHQRWTIPPYANKWISALASRRGSRRQAAKKTGCSDVRRGDRPPYNKMEIRETLLWRRSERTGKYKDKPGIRSSEWVLGKKREERPRRNVKTLHHLWSA